MYVGITANTDVPRYCSKFLCAGGKWGRAVSSVDCESQPSKDKSMFWVQGQQAYAIGMEGQTCQ